MIIKVYTNLVAEGWNGESLNTGCGGSEEMLIELMRELAKKGHDITIYHNGEHGVYDGVKYCDHRDFNPWEFSDVFISFKARGILRQSINANKILHWSHEIEPKLQQSELEGLDNFLCVSEYHKRNIEPDSEKVVVMYNHFDKERMDRNKVKREKGSLLYCSSLDRGLEELLNEFPKIKKAMGVKKLYITYGWDFINQVIKRNPSMIVWKDKMEKLIAQDGIEFVGRLSYDDMCKMYWKAEYWCLPLNNPQSELFCINAAKANGAGCKPLVRRIGALQETVQFYYDFDKIKGDKVGNHNFPKGSIKKNKEFALNFTLEKNVERWEELMTK